MSDFCDINKYKSIENIKELITNGDMVILSDRDSAPSIPALIKSKKEPKRWINNETSQLNELTQKNLLIRVNTRSGVQNNTSQSEAETNTSDTTDVASAAEEPVEVKPEAQWKFVYKDELGLRSQTNNVPVTLTTSDGTRSCFLE